MFCKQCGAPLEPGDDFCVNCGARQTPEDSWMVPKFEFAPSPKKNRLPWIILGGSLIVSMIVVTLILVLGTNRDREQPEHVVVATKSIECVVKGQLEEFLDLVPEEVVEAAAAQMGVSVEKFADYLKELGAQIPLAMRETLGANWVCTYQMTEDTPITGERLRQLQQRYEKFGLEVEAARSLLFELEYEGSKLSETRLSTIVVVRIGSRWYYSSTTTETKPAVGTSTAGFSIAKLGIIC